MGVVTKSSKAAIWGAIMGKCRQGRGTLRSGAQAWPSFIKQEPTEASRRGVGRHARGMSWRVREGKCPWRIEKRPLYQSDSQDV